MSKDIFDLTGKSALVTGGAYGLGCALVRGLANQGARVIAVSRSEQQLRETVEPLGPNHRYIVGDITKQALYDELEELASDVDILVNNAGGDPHTKPWGRQTPDEWRETLEVNVIASARLCGLFTPAMAERGWGRVINVASIYGSLGQDPRSTPRDAGAGAYVAAKHGVIGLSRYLATQLSHTGVTVNTLSPGMISWRTPQTEDSRQVRIRNADHTPVKRNGQPEDFVGAVVFLASESASFVTGHNLVVDGGWSIW